jgi:hypothetical protein
VSEQAGVSLVYRWPCMQRPVPVHWAVDVFACVPASLVRLGVHLAEASRDADTDATLGGIQASLKSSSLKSSSTVFYSNMPRSATSAASFTKVRSHSTRLPSTANNLHRLVWAVLLLPLGMYPRIGRTIANQLLHPYATCNSVRRGGHDPPLVPSGTRPKAKLKLQGECVHRLPSSRLIDMVKACQSSCTHTMMPTGSGLTYLMYLEQRTSGYSTHSKNPRVAAFRHVFA